MQSYGNIGAAVPEYQLVQRKRKNGRTVLYVVVPRNDGHPRHKRMVQLVTAPADLSKTRDKARRDREAHAEVIELQRAGKLSHSADLAEYLDTFWDFEQSEYIRDRRRRGHTISPAYAAANRALIRDYFLPYVRYRHVQTLTDLSKSILIEWANNLFENGAVRLPGNPEAERRISPTTQNKVRQAVHVALEHAVKVDLIPFNPMAAVDRAAETPRTREIFERHELAQLFQPSVWRNLDIRAYAGCLLAAETGARLGEVRALRKRNVWLDERSGMYMVALVDNWIDGQGLKPPKWGKVREPAPIRERVADALVNVMKVHPFNPGPEDFVLFGDKRGLPVAKHTLERDLRKALKIAEIPEHGRTFHCFRHTWVSLINASGASLETTQRAIGHTSTRMTSEYRHITDADRLTLLEAQKKLY